MGVNRSVITVKNLTKVFRIPHIRHNNLKTYLINLRQARKYDDFYALKNINLTINRGDFVGIIGRNGSGKSTLLKLMTGILNPTSGEVIVKESISPFLELGVGFNPELTAWENIFLYCSILGLSKQESLESYPKVLEFSELEQFIDSPLKTFSSGMQVRLAFSVAIQARSPILMVDEVLAVGDAPFQEKCYSVFTQLKNEGKTIVFVSHAMESILKFCDKVVLLQHGEEVREGKPKEIVDYYLESVHHG